MDGSQGQAGQSMVQPQQHSNLIRTDQVQKLPHLNDQQKAQHTHVVRSLWEALNTRDPQSHEYQTAHMKLSQLSQNLMKGMRMFQQNRQQALQQQQAQAAAAQQTGQPVQRTQSNNPQNLSQLLPQIQTKVSSLNFYLPPNVTQEQVQTWIPEARLRYGIALQKQEVGRARIADLRSQFAQRQAQGQMPNDEVQEFKNRQLAAEKLFREGSDFLNKFKEQQESFKMQSQQNPQINQGVQGSSAPAAQPAPTAPAPQATQAPTANATNAMPGQAPTPAPHTINSAVNAARNQAGQTAMSPTTSQPGQAPTSSANATPAPPNAQQPGQRPQPPSQQGTPGAQVTFTQTPNADGSTPTPTGPQQVNNQAQGPPRPLSHQAAMQQAAQNYNANQNQPAPQAVNQAGNNQQPHPQGYLSNRSTDASARNINMAIPKTLNISSPEAVQMPAARPSLSGGPSHPTPGMLGQPAVQKHPGYVLEGEGQHVLSKKMLDILVRQVTGGGEGEMLTPDAEEVLESPQSERNLIKNPN
jgi:transcription initiation factor TFIID subunit 12